MGELLEKMTPDQLAVLKEQILEMEGKKNTLENTDEEEEPDTLPF